MRSDAFRAAALAKDFSAVDELFTEDVVFRSPVVFKPYEGREALQIAPLRGRPGLRELPLHRPGRGRRHRGAPVPRRRVGKRELDGVDILRFDDDGLISELMVMVRPMSGMHALAEEMRARLEAAT